MVDRSAKIAVVGATGAVGQEILSALLDRGYASQQIGALGSERSEGDEIEFGDDTIPVEKAGPDAFRGIHLALIAAPPEVAAPLALSAQGAGAWVVDTSAAFRADPKVPLVLPAVNGAAASAPFEGRIVSVPSATTAALATALQALDALSPTDAHVTALLSASSAGLAGVQALEQQTAALLSGREPEGSVFPHRLGFNVLPQAGRIAPGAIDSEEELAWTKEGDRLGGAIARAQVSGTALVVPVFYGHLLSVTVHLNARPGLDEVRAALKASPALKLLDEPAERVYPMPMLVTADAAVHVGRVRAARGDGWFHLLVAVDNAGRGAALNAVEVGELLLARGR
ncbi:MAG TPA: aspartate-semialdehyde dehydrogenase [Myxococcaceae bacterium]|nr:aspartate-semialdehyde dehydrogenase [Myxococcaceae bacterium]